MVVDMQGVAPSVSPHVTNEAKGTPNRRILGLISVRTRLDAGSKGKHDREEGPERGAGRHASMRAEETAIGLSCP